MAGLNLNREDLIITTHAGSHWPQNTSRLVNGRTLALDSLIDGFRIQGTGTGHILTLPLLNADDTLRKVPAHQLKNSQDRVDFAGTYSLLQLLFGGYGRMLPHQIHPELPWHVERRAVPAGARWFSEIKIFQKPFGDRLLLTPLEDGLLQIKLEKETPFAGIRSQVVYDPTGKEAPRYKNGFFAIVSKLKFNKNNIFPLIERAATQLKNTHPAQEEVVMPPPESILSLKLLERDTLLIRGAYLYDPIYPLSDWSRFLSSLYREAFIAVHLPKPIPPLTYGNPKNLLASLIGPNQKPHYDNTVERMINDPDSHTLEDWENVANQLNLRQVQNPHLFKGAEHLIRARVLLPTGLRRVVFRPNRAIHSIAP